MDFAGAIKILLEDKGLKQSDLCRLTKIPTSLMSEYVKGRKSPAINNAIAVANALNVTLDELVRREKSTSNSIEIAAPARYSLTDSEYEHIKKYRTLDERGKETVDAVLNTQCGFVAASRQTNTTDPLSHT